MKKQKPWYNVLLAARRIHKAGGQLTSLTLALESGLETRLASAWLFKLERWGYVLREGKKSTGKRWIWCWGLTRWGHAMGLQGKASSRRQTPLKIAANPAGKQGNS